MLFYNIFLFLYKAGIHLAATWNPKARLWVSGRSNTFELLQAAIIECKGKKIVWMHCASLGEFEQGRPLLNSIIEHSPEVEFFITFFSPSGFEKIKKDKEYKYVFYLPMDSSGNAKKWLGTLKPQLVLWVKYEYWYYYLREIQANQIPLIMVSAIYRPSQIFFKWYGKLYVKILNAFSHFFVQNSDSKNTLKTIISEDRITISGDTRCDRVINIESDFSEVPGIKEFCAGKTVVVIGSSWEDDETEWVHFVRTKKEIKFIIAPHEIDKDNLVDVKKRFPESILYSDWLAQANVPNQIKAPHCLIINNIGILSRLYYYATITYVGGGFGKNGLHNILEAAVYGKPVIFGPEYEKNFEATDLIENSGGISIENALELEKVMNELLTHPEEITNRGEAAKKYVYENSGATKKIATYLADGRLI